MHPTTLFGVLALGLALRYAAMPRPQWLPVVGAFGAATWIAGVLGTATGLMATFAAVHNVAADKQVAIACMGAKESLNNIVWASLFCVLTAILVGVGAWRGSSKATA